MFSRFLPEFVRKHVDFFLWLAAAFILVLFLARNPYSERTLIPNFEPYPDTLHYVVSARSFLTGHGFNLYRYNVGGVPPNVPPLYSLVLLPIYLISSDPRSFYWMNVVIALAAFGIFGLIAKKLFADFWVRALLFGCLVSSFYFFWIPSLAMAENLLFVLTLLAVWVFTRPATVRSSVVAGILSWCFYGTKYASVPLGIIFFLFYAAKIIREQKSWKISKELITFFLSSFFSFALLVLVEAINKGPENTLILPLLVLLGIQTKTEGFSGTSNYFSFGYLAKHLGIYWRGLSGGQAPFLWENKPLLEPVFMGLAFLGLVFGVIKKQWRWLCIFILSLVIIDVLFLAAFNTVDMRYLYHFLPLFLIGMGIGLQEIRSGLNKWPIAWLGFIALLFLALAGLRFSQSKKQLLLNLKYAETPWYYISVQNFNSYFVKTETKKPVFITALDPYFIDLYSNKNYTLLPLSTDQDFNRQNNQPEKVWGEGDYSDLHNLYRQKVQDGYAVFTTNYGLGNEQQLHIDFDDLNKDFVVTKVQDGCLQACNIYQVTEKSK